MRALLDGAADDELLERVMQARGVNVERSRGLAWLDLRLALQEREDAQLKEARTALAREKPVEAALDGEPDQQQLLAEEGPA